MFSVVGDYAFSPLLQEIPSVPSPLAITTVGGVENQRDSQSFPHEKKQRAASPLNLRNISLETRINAGAKRRRVTGSTGSEVLIQVAVSDLPANCLEARCWQRKPPAPRQIFV